MRLLIDVAAFKQGGAERQLLGLAGGLQVRGHRVLLTVNQTIEGYVGELAVAPFDVLELGCASGYDRRVTGRVAATIRGFRPDVCLCVEFSATLWGRLAALATGVPVVIAEHLTTEDVAGRRLLANRLLGRRTAAVVGCAQAQVGSLIAAGDPPDRIRVIPNGVDVRRFTPDEDAGRALRGQLGIDDGAFVVALVAAHRPEKRFDRFVELIERLSALRPGTAVWGVSAGDGPLLDADRELAAESASAGRLAVLGGMDDVRPVYAAADVVVLVSDDIETYPMVFLEAQACECTVAGFDQGGVRETLLDGQTGLVVPAGDLGALPQALAGLLDDAARRTKMAGAGRRFVADRCSLDVMVDEYERVLTNAARGTSLPVVPDVSALSGGEAASAASAAAETAGSPSDELVSVIMATYQRAEELPRAIDSVLAQTHRRWQLIVVDDGSTDATAGVLAHYDDPRIEVVTLPQNVGVSAARNVALDRLRGDWFTLLDSDDEMLPEALETLLSVPRLVDPDIDAVTCNCLDARTGRFSGLGLDGDGYLDLATEVSAMSGEFWGLTRTSLIGDLRFPEDVPGGENVFFYAVSARARRYYLHRALRIWHTEGAGRLTSRDTTDDLDTRGRYYASLVRHEGYLHLLRHHGPEKYAQIAFNMVLVEAAEGRSAEAAHWFAELRVVGGLPQRVFARLALLLGPAYTRWAFTTAGRLRAARRG